MGYKDDWRTCDETEYVKGLGMGRWHIGSDIRHSRQWWLRKYLEVNANREEKFIIMGRDLAKKILLGIGAMA